MAGGLPDLPIGVNVFADASLLLVDTLLNVAGAPQPWGIYWYGVPIVIADNVVEVSFHQDFRIATYPIENGGFISYNKVSMPFEARVRFSSGGNVLDRQLLIETIARIAGDTNKYAVVTPEKIYLDCNVVRQEYDRKASTAGLVVVDVSLQEVRDAGASVFSSTQSPTDQPTQQGGVVQPIERYDLPPLAPSIGH
jgi:hypothetical protein